MFGVEAVGGDLYVGLLLYLSVFWLSVRLGGVSSVLFSSCQKLFVLEMLLVRVMYEKPDDEFVSILLS